MNTARTSVAPAIDARLDEFRTEGLLGGIPLLSADRCRLLVRHLRSSPPPPQPQDWSKGRAASDRLIYDLATEPAVLDLVRTLLGPNVVLWGVAVVEKSPGEPHAWHTDIETSLQDGGSVSIWLGLEGTHFDSTLALIAGSHRVGKPVLQMAAEHGVSRDQVTSEMALAWAKRAIPQARLVQPVASDGQAVAFDGRIWHASFNRDPAATRTAIVLQYATADTAIRIPDFSRLEWPFRFKSKPRPPVISVCGQANERANRVVSPPRYETRSAETALRTHVHPLALPLAEDAESRWKPYPILRGRTRALGAMSAHVSVLSAGHSPHPPHEHRDEELLIVLDGQAELVVIDRADGRREQRTVPVEAGSFAYYPAYSLHTIRNTGTRPVTYLMFRWSGPTFNGDSELPCEIYEFGPAMAKDSDKPFSTTLVFEGQTSYLRKLHAHTSVAQPGGGYDVHVDGHDVALVLQRGKIETLGETIEGPGVVYYSAGEPHGLRNVGDTPARYLVFEFHPATAADLGGPIPLSPPPSGRERLRAKLQAARKSFRRAVNRGKRVLGRKTGAASYLIAAHRKIRGPRP